MARTPKDTQPANAAPRHNWIRPLADEARANAAAAFSRMGFDDPALVLRWREIAGPEVARLAQPMKLSGDALTLRAVPGAALFLAHEKRALCDRINAWLGRTAVTQIKFWQAAGPLPTTPSTPKPRAAGPLPVSDPSRRYQGADGLAKALQALARRRQPV